MEDLLGKLWSLLKASREAIEHLAALLVVSVIAVTYVTGNIDAFINGDLDRSNRWALTTVAIAIFLGAWKGALGAPEEARAAAGLRALGRTFGAGLLWAIAWLSPSITNIFVRVPVFLLMMYMLLGSFIAILSEAWEIYKDAREAKTSGLPKPPPPPTPESFGDLPWKAEDDWGDGFGVFRYKGEKLTYRRDGTVRWQDSTFENPRIAIASIDSYCG